MRIAFLLLLLMTPVFMTSEFILQLFSQYDANSDGYISEGECARQDSIDSNSMQVNIHISNALFDLFDENTDKKISVDEFNEFISARDEFILSDVSLEASDKGLEL